MCAMLNLFHLAFRHTAPVVDDTSGLEARGLVKLDQELPHHVGQILDDLLAEKLLLKRPESLVGSKDRVTLLPGFEKK